MKAVSVKLPALQFKKRLVSSRFMAGLVPVLSIVLAVIMGAILIKIAGYNPLIIIPSLVKTSFGSRHGLTETILVAAALIFTSLSVAIAFRIRFWSIGAEGQMIIGAIVTSWVALFAPEMPRFAMLLTIIIASALAGAIWALIAAIPRVYLGTNEIVTTLMLNYVASSVMLYLIHVPWKDLSVRVVMSPPFREAAILPRLGGSRIHIGFVFAIIAAILLYVLIRTTKFGYIIRAVGESSRVARYAGMNISSVTLMVVGISGALAALAGMGEVAGVTLRLKRDIMLGGFGGYGYTGIIIAWLSNLNPLTCVVVSVLFAGLLVGGHSMQIMGLPIAIVNVFTSIILIFLMGCSILVNYRISISWKHVQIAGRKAANS